jgi:N-acetylglutamate synthase-like GNAT family acetyltransferase
MIEYPKHILDRATWYKSIKPKKSYVHSDSFCIRTDYGYVRGTKAHNNKKAMWCAGIGVSPEKLGQGYGKRLVRAMEYIARRKGFKEIHLQTYDDTEQFYEKLGYVKCGNKLKKTLSN